MFELIQIMIDSNYKEAVLDNSVRLVLTVLLFFYSARLLFFYSETQVSYSDKTRAVSCCPCFCCQMFELIQITIDSNYKEAVLFFFFFFPCFI